MSEFDTTLSIGSGLTGLQVRNKINEHTEALATLNSSVNEPDQAYPYMLWADTGNGKLKQYNPDTSAWIVVGNLGEVAWGAIQVGDTVYANAGTASSPGLSFDGDTNTGFSRPTADKIVVSTGGVGRLTVTTTSVTAEQAFQVNGSFTANSTSTFSGAITLNDNASITPQNDSTVNLGTNTVRFSNIYADTFTGAFTGNLTGNVTGNADTATDANDSALLDGQDSAYYRNPSNLSSAVPVSKGGTGSTAFGITACRNIGAVYSPNTDSGTGLGGLVGVKQLLIYGPNNTVNNLIEFQAVSTINNIYESFWVYLNESDIKLKKDISDFSENALEKINSIHTKRFRWERQSGDSPKNIGFIAQELEKIIPEAVFEAGEGDQAKKHIATLPYLAVLTKAVQELSQKVTELEIKLSQG